MTPTVVFFKILTTEYLSCLSYKNRLSQIDANFAVNLLCAAFSLPTTTENRCRLLVLDTVLFIISHSRDISGDLQHKNSLSSNTCSVKSARGKAPGRQALAPYIPPLEAGGFYGAFHKKFEFLPAAVQRDEPTEFRKRTDDDRSDDSAA